MQLKLTFNLNGTLSLPLGHHAVLQGFIYNLLCSSKEYASFLHDTGYKDGEHSFKLFVYSTLRGRHSVDSGRITYYDRVYLDIRSPLDEFCNTIMRTLQECQSFEMEHQTITLSECAFTKRIINEDDVVIRMMSPITLSTTYRENDKKKTRYISPADSDFSEALFHNTASKYRAAYQKDPMSGLNLEPIELTESDKYVTKFNNRIYITGWNGSYRLTGDPSLLTFLYDTGIGSRNSQGFGMFEVVSNS